MESTRVTLGYVETFLETQCKITARCSKVLGCYISYIIIQRSTVAVIVVLTSLISFNDVVISLLILQP